MRSVACIVAINIVGSSVAQEGPEVESVNTLIRVLSSRELVGYRVQESGQYLFKAFDHEMLIKVRSYYSDPEKHLRARPELERHWNGLRKDAETRLLSEFSDVEVVLQKERVVENGVDRVVIRARVAENSLAEDVAARERIEARATAALGAFHSTFERFLREDAEMTKLQAMIQNASPPLGDFTTAEITRSGADYIGVRSVETEQEMLIPLHRIALVARIPLLDPGIVRERSSQSLIEVLAGQKITGYRRDESGRYVMTLPDGEMAARVRNYHANLSEYRRKQELLERRWNELKRKELEGLARNGGLRVAGTIVEENDQGQLVMFPMLPGNPEQALRTFVDTDPEMIRLRKMMQEIEPPLKEFMVAEIVRTGTAFIELRDLETKRDILVPLYEIAHVEVN